MSSINKYIKIKDKIKLINILIGFFVIVLSLYLDFNIYYILHNYLDNVVSILNMFYYNESIEKYIYENKEFFLWFVFIYILFLWYIKRMRWLVFDNKFNQWNYIYFILTIRNILSVLSPFYLTYIYVYKNHIEFWALIWILTMSFVIGWISNLYISIRKDYNLSVALASTWKLEEKYKTFNYLFTLLLPFSIFLIIFSFIIIPIWIINKFNLITILYIHIYFIIMYVLISLLENKFQKLIDIKFDWKLRKDILIADQDNEKYILISKKETYIVDKSKIDYILYKNTDIK